MSDANKLKKHTDLRDHYQRQLDHIRADLDHPPAFFLDDPRDLSRKPTEGEQRRIKTLERNIAMEDAVIEILQRRMLGADQRRDEDDSSRFAHSDDFRSVKFGGVSHTVTKSQAAVIRLLYEASLTEMPEVAHERIMETVGLRTSQLRDTFKGSPLWGTLIVWSHKGLYRLNLQARK
ncbi:MAG TPA: hypothetical protein VGX94_12725 [Terriglobia bacterium]|nr:hypothetical protein [Terriglobia bacterium]